MSDQNELSEDGAMTFATAGATSQGMSLKALTTADLMHLLQAGGCVDMTWPDGGLSLTSAAEPLRQELLELRRLRAWRETVRAAVRAGRTGQEAIDRANEEMMRAP